MRILFLNWKDTSNPSAGGAETFTEEIGRRLVTLGNDITIFTSSFNGPREETQRFGMKIIREGGKYGVYSKARKYVTRHRSEYDVLIDEINTLPFRVAKVARGVPVVALIHQLAREIWFYETRFPLSVFGYFALEPLLLRGYRNMPTLTVSDSTRNDLLKIGFKHVHIVRNGIGTRPLDKCPTKSSVPVLIFLGRLVRSKLPQHAITAHSVVKSVFPNAELWVLGDGYLRKEVEEGASNGVRFFGKVSNEEKFDLLRKAHLLLAPSIREGWGISVIEANAMGTPAIGYAVNGLRDSIIDGVTGLLVEPRNPLALGKATIELLSHQELFNRLSENALRWSRQFSWDDATKNFLSFVQAVPDSI